MKFQKYKFRKYDKSYPKLFVKEKAKLKKILPKGVIIEHCGSSAVPGLGGKGIIDIFISVKKKDVKKSVNKLKKAGYLYIGGGGKNREYFETPYVNNCKERKVHLHLTYHNCFEIRRAVAFRDYLIKNPKIVKEYVKIKKEAVKHAKGEGKKYREYKHKFIQEVGRKAMRNIK